MSDRELLELAAKAAGIELLFDGDWPYRIKRTGNSQDWNPLTDDGDALRLAAHCQTDIQFLLGAVSVSGMYESDSDDYMKDVRRAIVRAAAEVGRAMV